MPVADSGAKRPAESVDSALVPSAKKPRQEIVSAGPRRTSNLLSPIMLLQGHEGDIFTAKFSPDGTCLASGGFDRKILLWNVYGECENFAMLTGHVGAVMELHFSCDSEVLWSCATDRTIRMWDMATGACIRRLKGHTNIVNSCHPARRGPQLVASASDDCTIKVWDSRKRDAVHTFESMTDGLAVQVTAITFNDTAEQLISGGLDNDLKVWDLRKNGIASVMKGHTDTVTGLELSPDGSYVLSNSMDSSLRAWDVRPFAPEQRCVKVFLGHQHNFEKNLLRCCWSPDSSQVSCGSADRYMYVWDVASRRILYKLPGHQGSINETDFHPLERIVLSASSDKKIYLGEIE